MSLHLSAMPISSSGSQDCYLVSFSKPFACRHCTTCTCWNEERTTNPVHDHHFPEGPRKESRVSTAAKVDAAWDPPNSESGNNILLSSYHPRVGNKTFIGWVEFPLPKLHHETVPAMRHAGSTTPGKSALTSAMGITHGTSHHICCRGTWCGTTSVALPVASVPCYRIHWQNTFYQRLRKT